MVSYNGRSRSSRAIFLTVLIAVIMCVPISAMGRLVDKFEGDKASVTVDLNAAGTIDRAAVIPWNYTATTLHATMNVSAAPHTTGGKDYPLAPSINVAGQGSPEWAFKGKGYGAYGLQSGFEDETVTYSKELIEAGPAAPPSILLPSDAQLSDASLRVKGDIAKVNYSENYFSSNGVYKVAYSKNFNTLFIGGPYFGVIAKNLNDGTFRRINTDTYPGLPEWTVEDLKYDDVNDLLLVATLGGLQIINFKTMEPVEVLNRYSDINTLTNNIYSVDYDPVTGLMAIGESGDIAFFNYTSRTKLAYMDVGGNTVYSVQLDLANKRIWAGTSWGVYGEDLTNYQMKYRYNTVTTPALPTWQAMDVTYDGAHDKLFVGTRGGSGTSGLTIINVQAGTKTDVTDATTPALPNRNVWALSYDKGNDRIYVATDWCVGVYSLNPLAEVTRYSTVSTPAILHTYDQDVLYIPSKGYMAVGTYLGASIVDVGKGTNIMDFSRLFESPVFPQGGFYDVNVDQSLNLAVVSQYYGVVSLLNLTSGLIDANLTNANFMNGNACGYITETKYDTSRHFLMTACYSGTWPNYKAGFGVYNVSSRKFYKYYDEATPTSLQPTAGGTGTINGFDYDTTTNTIVLVQSSQGVTRLDMTANLTTKYNAGSTPSVPNTWGLYDVAYIPARSLAVVANYGYGVNIFNFSAGTRVDIRGNTNPALSSTAVDRVGADTQRAYIFVAGYNGLENFDISTIGAIKLLGRYNTGTNPYMPVTWYYDVHYDAATQMIYTASGGGAYCLDFKNTVLAKHFTTTTSPALFQSTVYGYTNQKAKDWDIISTWNAIQIIKHDPSPMDVEMWIEDQLVWKKGGIFNTTVNIGNLGAKIQMALAGAKDLDPDQYGIVMAKLGIKLVTQRAGTLTLDGISFEYQHTARTPDLSQAINDYIQSAGTGWDNKVPITVNMSSAGKLTLGALKVEIDEAPVFTDFPNNLWIYENTFQTKLLDINNYVTDDFDLKTDLKFTATALTNDTRVAVGIFEGHYLYIDSLTKPASLNWTGAVQMTVNATDTRGLTRTSDPFIVRVEPVHAVVITSSPVTSVFEAKQYEYDVTAVSHRALPLTYKLDEVPAGMTINGTTGVILWSPIQKDVGNHEIIVNVTDGKDSAYQTYWLTVINVNDVPKVSAIPEITVLEGVKKVVDMSKYITDPDDPASNMSLMVRSSYTTVTGLNVTLLYPLKSGITQENITFMVSDGKAMVTSNLRVKVLGVFKVDQVPDQVATEGTMLKVNMAPFIHDPQGKKLTISATSTFVKINGTSLDILYPVGSKVSLDNVTVKVSDGTAINTTTVLFKVKVTAVFPTVAITTPTSDKTYSDKVTVMGTAGISSGQVTKVMVRIDGGEWVQAAGTTSWSYEFKVKDLKLSDGTHYLYVQSFSNDVSSQQASTSFKVKNPTQPRVSSESYLGIGLIIGLILAIIIGVVAYTLGKRKRGGPEAPVEEHQTAGSFEPVEEEQPMERPSRPIPSIKKEETKPIPDKEETAEVTSPEEDQVPTETSTTPDTVKEPEVEAPKEESKAEPTKPPEEETVEPGPPMEEKPAEVKVNDSKDSTDDALSEILKKLDN